MKFHCSASFTGSAIFRNFQIAPEMMLLPVADCVLHAGHAMVIFKFFRQEVPGTCAIPNLSETHNKMRSNMSSQSELLLKIGFIVR